MIGGILALAGTAVVALIAAMFTARKSGKTKADADAQKKDRDNADRIRDDVRDRLPGKLPDHKDDGWRD